MTMPVLTLPDSTTRSLSEVIAAVDTYDRAYPAVFDLYDLPSGGPHDELLPIDLLAVNALNGWGSGQPMNGMTTAWLARSDISLLTRPVSREPLEALSDAELDAEAKKVDAALKLIDGLKWFGYTTSAKLFHRLRPNLGPIWDARVEQWYGSSGSWAAWAKRVYAHVREPGTQHCLIAARNHLGRPLSLLRVWDVLLWQLRGPSA